MAKVNVVLEIDTDQLKESIACIQLLLRSQMVTKDELQIYPLDFLTKIKNKIENLNIEL